MKLRKRHAYIFAIIETIIFSLLIIYEFFMASLTGFYIFPNKASINADTNITPPSTIQLNEINGVLNTGIEYSLEAFINENHVNKNIIWKFDFDSFYYYETCNRINFICKKAGTYIFEAISAIDSSICASTEILISGENYVLEQYKPPKERILFYSSYNEILSYAYNCKINYFDSLKINCIYKDEDGNILYSQPKATYLSNSNIRIDDYGNVIYDDSSCNKILNFSVVDDSFGKKDMEFMISEPNISKQNRIFNILENFVFEIVLFSFHSFFVLAFAGKAKNSKFLFPLLLSPSILNLAGCLFNNIFLLNHLLNPFLTNIIIYLFYIKFFRKVGINE